MRVKRRSEISGGVMEKPQEKSLTSVTGLGVGPAQAETQLREGLKKKNRGTAETKTHNYVKLRPGSPSSTSKENGKPSRASLPSKRKKRKEKRKMLATFWN